MITTFMAHGKEVLAVQAGTTQHYADAVSPRAAEIIADALNKRNQ